MKFSLLFLSLIIAAQSFGQLSEGQGEKQIIANGMISIYVPKYFKLNDDPPGLIHNTSKTMVFIIKVPRDKHEQINAGKGNQLLVDPSMQKLKMEPRKGMALGRVKKDVEYMQFEISGVQFERINSYVKHKGEIYLLMANYAVKLKSQVYEEVKEIYGSIEFVK